MRRIRVEISPSGELLDIMEEIMAKEAYVSRQEFILDCLRKRRAIYLAYERIHR